MAEPTEPAPIITVRIPSPLHSYTGGSSGVQARGRTIRELITDLDRTCPGIGFRVVDEQGRLRRHMRVYVNSTMTRDLDGPVVTGDEVALMQALSGG